MPYPTLPDRRIGYDNDGSIGWYGSTTLGPTYSLDLPTWNGLSGLWEERQGFNGANGNYRAAWLFMPELRYITAFWAVANVQEYGRYIFNQQWLAIAGSSDTTNGLDGTWEDGIVTGGMPSYVANDSWRAGIRLVQFSEAKKAIRLYSIWENDAYHYSSGLCHLYGHPLGSTDDLIFIDASSGTEFPIDLDWNEIAIGVNVVKQFKVKNISPTKTANTVGLACNDTDFTISTDDITYGTSISVGTLTAGSSSATYYVKANPAGGSTPGPRFSRIVGTVGSWT